MKRFNDIIDKIFSPSVLMWLVPLALIIPNIVLDITDYSNWLQKVVNVLLPLGVYMWLIGLSRNVGRTTLYMIPFMLYASFQTVLLFLYGESIIAIDMFLNLVTTNVGEASELLGNLSLAILTVIILYLLPMIWAAVLVCRKRLASATDIRLCRRIGKYTALAGFLALIAAYCFIPRFNILRDVFPVNVVNNTVMAARRTAATQEYFEKSASFNYGAESTRDNGIPEVYVLVIGETSRADNWQLAGYDRPTNPLLSQRRSLVFFDKALSQSNTTHKSVPLLLSHVSVETFNDSIYTTKSLLSAFNQSGYRTAFISNQARNHSFIDFFAREAQVAEFLRDEGIDHYDHELLPRLAKFLDSPGNKKFVVLHTYGSHFNYKDRYPRPYRHFTPESAAAATVSNRDELLNAYDNTIIYTDALVNSVINMLDSLDCSSAMMYLSDHGEDIFDDRRGRFLHSSPVPTYYQIHVPILLWTSDEYNQLYPSVMVVADSHRHNNIASNEVVFDTMLRLAGIVTKYGDNTKSIIDTAYVDRPRRYLNDYNEWVPLRHAGLRSYDYDKLAQKNISVD